MGDGFVVFGGAGFIGSHIVDELMVNGNRVTVVDNMSEGKVENLAMWRNHKNFELVRGDIRDYEMVKRVCHMKSGVFHLAAMSRIQPSITDPLLAFSQNYMGTVHVAEACRQAGVPRVVYSASSSAYGRASDWACTPQPAKKRSPGDPDELVQPTGLTEDLPTDCLTPYSLSKKGGEEIMELYTRLYGLSTCSLRYFNVYGPRHQESGAYATVIAIFRKQRRHGIPLTIVGDGEQRRDFTFVSDVVRANMLAMFARDVTGTLNIGSGRNHSINELAARIGGPVEHLPERQGEARLTLSNYGRANELLGWEPAVDLDAGLDMIERYEAKFPASGLIVPGVR